MADLRIVDAPEIPTENITGEEKLPTGGNGNYSISLDSLADYTKTKKDLADNASVDGKVNGVRQELDAHIEDLLNPHQVTKGQIGLGNVDNTADADKPVSNSTQAAIISAVAPKADKSYVDNALSSKSDKTYVDTQLALKANKADVYIKSETYTKQESNDLVDISISTALTPVNASLDLAKRGIANRYDPALIYNSGERVVLNNGDIVKSTVDGNTNNPNVDMTGWYLVDKKSYVNTVAELLNIANPKDGDVVYVKGYYVATNFALAQPYKGGDLFHYASSLSAVNNGVTIFNGWVRDTSDKTLTTDDAGLLGDGTDLNVTTKLQTIADVAGDGYEIDFIGNYKVSTSIYFNSKKSIKLSSVNGIIEGDKDAWTWGSPINGTNRRGILVFKDCPNLDINRLVIKGIQKNIFGSFQDGDSCIQLINCFNPSIRLCTLTNCFAWAIVGEGCEFPVIEYNVISNVVHQSGVNICVGGGKNAKINFNHITNCGLYGIEFETYTALNDDMFEAFGNVIKDCYAGITPTGSGVTKGTIIGNSIYRSGYAAIMMQNIPNAENISVFNNPLDENYRGAIFNNSPNVKFVSNPITGKARSDIYLKLNPDWFVLKVLDSNNFLIHLDAVTATGDIYIGGVTYTVTAIASQADPSLEFALPTLRKVTVSQTITDALVLNKHTQRKVLANGLTEANITMLNASNGLLVKDNTLSGGQYCIYYDQDSAPIGSPKQYVYDNEMLDFGINAILHTKSTNHVFYRGNKTKSTAIATYNIHKDLIKNGSFETKSIKSVNCAAQSVGSIPVNRFGNHKNQLIVGAYVSFYNATTSGTTAIKLNGGSAILSIDGVGSPPSGRLFVQNVSIENGMNTVELIDTVGDLTFPSAFVDILVPA